MALPLAPSRPRLPDAGAVDYGDPAAVKAYIQSLVTALSVALESRPAANVSRASMLMLSPDGAAWELGVSNAGAVTAAKRQDPLP